MKRGCLLLLFLAFISCDSKTPFSLPSGVTNNTPTTTNAPVAVTLTSSPSTLTFGGTASITATVFSSTTATSTVPDGTQVTFITTLGTVTPQATTSNGVASATFTAGTVQGIATIVASADPISKSVTVTVNAPQTGSIEFVSTSPQVIGVKGGGQTENALVTFLVKDIIGNPVVDGLLVSFTMSGPSGGKLPANGGEYIGEIDTTPTTASGATKNGGQATVFLNSGAVAGAVTVVASVTVGGVTFSSSSPTISIGGGIASAPHFNIVATIVNLPGLVFSGITSTITAFSADRFGNSNILKGTSVSFYTEAGAIGSSGITDSNGATSVVFRTQAPSPFDVLPGDGNPIDGHVTVLAALIGEEGFVDSNGNGLFDAGEPFTDLPEPFIDKNDNGIYDSDEFFLDSNGNGGYSGENGVWDGPGCKDAGCLASKTIWDTMRLAFTSGAFTCSISTDPPGLSLTIGAGFTRQFSFTLGDKNNNALVAGTTITVSSTKGTLGGTQNFTVLDQVGGPEKIFFSLADPDTDAILDPYTLTVKVVPGVVGGFSPGGCESFVSGTVQ